eukprot:Blabericola_migrator_1__4868@NODE_2548_length_2620_cov_279_856639_g1030_i2_p1_GENE_NODE_2548_length_2620_cov_279_856639_g1030_i2NODE_2548_length_2620_cov_279_856639_g1030_i2_p1_ORF_typecomplete_len303_score57_22Lactamase_B/PF00753_27/1_4e15HAGH_C/PF16123_5/1_1e13Lactamase_B_2/PF12706_7/4_9e05Lactamase_B_3/PF13483_6/0_00018Lactamase_B_5/PF14597_6/0_0098_NODE_2548_length_2620_cov_279_856639_g1030_i29891897
MRFSLVSLLCAIGVCGCVGCVNMCPSLKLRGAKKSLGMSHYKLDIAFKWPVYVVPYNSDNLGYLIQVTTEDGKSVGLAVDAPVKRAFDECCKAAGCEIEAVLTTHYHSDHQVIPSEWTDAVTIYKSSYEKTTGNKDVQDGETIKFYDLTIKPFHTPTHTRGHMCYLMTDVNGHNLVFTGDHLFTAGCGRFFEGNSVSMIPSIERVYTECPRETLMLPGHHYAIGNLKFALHVEPSNEDMKNALERAEKVGRFEPSTLEQEMLFNPFIRSVLMYSDLIKSIGSNESKEALLQRLRNEKDTFRA